MLIMSKAMLHGSDFYMKWIKHSQNLRSIFIGKFGMYMISDLRSGTSEVYLVS